MECYVHIDVLLSSFIVIVFFTLISSFPCHCSDSSPPPPFLMSFLTFSFLTSLFVFLYFYFMSPFYFFVSFSIFAPYFILSLHFPIFIVSFFRSSLLRRILLKLRGHYLSSSCLHVDCYDAKVEIVHS